MTSFRIRNHLARRNSVYGISSQAKFGIWRRNSVSICYYEWKMRRNFDIRNRFFVYEINDFVYELHRDEIFRIRTGISYDEIWGGRNLQWGGFQTWDETSMILPMFSSKCVSPDFVYGDEISICFIRFWDEIRIFDCISGACGPTISYTKSAWDESFVYEITDFVYEIWPETNLTAQKRYFVTEMWTFDDFTNSFPSNAFCDFGAPNCVHFDD